MPILRVLSRLSDLRAAVPGIGVIQRRRDTNGYETRQRMYQGIGLTPAGMESLAVARSGTRDFV